MQALDAAIGSAAPADLARALLAADAALAERGLRVALAEAYGPRLATLDAAALPESARTALVELLLLAGLTAEARAAAGPAPGPRIETLVAIAGGGAAAPAAKPDDLTAAALEGLAAETPADDREARLALMLAGGRQGQALIEALALVGAGPAVDPQALRAALLTLRLAGQADGARAIALQTLLTGAG